MIETMRRVVASLSMCMLHDANAYLGGGTLSSST